jgi:hypothetical protein
MPRFLTPEWLAELDGAARARTGVPDEVRLVFQQVVTGCPGAGDDGADVRYHLRFGDGRVSVHPGQAPAPDLTVTADYLVAAALARGEVNAQQALAAGHLKLSGNVDLLFYQSRALARLGDVFAAVREKTTY